MQITLSELSVFLLILALAGLNAFLYLRLKKLSKGEPSYEARMLLHDLTAGSALVRVERVAPTDVFLRSPRHL